MKTEQTVLVNARDVASRYGITTKTLQRWVHDERVEFPQPRTIGNRWYFRLALLEAWEKKEENSAAN